MQLKNCIPVIFFFLLSSLLYLLKKSTPALHSLGLVVNFDIIMCRMYQVRRCPENLTPIAERGFISYVNIKGTESEIYSK